MEKSYTFKIKDPIIKTLKVALYIFIIKPEHIISKI